MGEWNGNWLPLTTVLPSCRYDGLALCNIFYTSHPGFHSLCTLKLMVTSHSKLLAQGTTSTVMLMRIRGGGRAVHHCKLIIYPFHLASYPCSVVPSLYKIVKMPLQKCSSHQNETGFSLESQKVS